LVKAGWNCWNWFGCSHCSSMLLVAVPMFILYEGSILFAMLGRRGAEKRRKALYGEDTFQGEDDERTEG